MATFVWTGTTGNNPLTGSNWNVAGVAQASPPTAADDVAFGTGTGATNNPCTIPTASTFVCRSADFTGYTGTFSFATATAVMTIGTTTPGTSNIALKLVSGMTLTLTGMGTINFVSTSATQQTITSAGKTLPNININGAGSSYVLADGLTWSASGTFTLSAGTFSTSSNNYALAGGTFNTGNATTRTLTLGASTVTLSNSWAASASTGLTVTANTAVCTITSSGTSNLIILASKDMNGLSFVVNGTSSYSISTGGSGAKVKNLTINGAASKVAGCSFSDVLTVTGTLRLNANSDANNMLVSSTVRGSARTLTVATLVCTNRVDFMDITGAGAAVWTTAASGASYFGDAGGNSGITMTPSALQTMTASGSWSDVTKWTSRIPLPQDDVVITGSNPVTLDEQRLGANIDLSGYSGTMTLTSSALGYDFFGSMTLGASMAWGSAPNTFTINASGRGTYIITSNGKAFFPAGTNGGFAINAPGGSYTLADNLDCKAPASAAFSVLAGTFNSASKTMDIGRLVVSGTITKSVTLGTSVITTYATGAVALLSIVNTATTVSANSASVVVGGAVSASTRTVDTGGFTLGSFSYTLPGSTGQLTIVGSSSFGTLNFSDSSNARTLRLTSGIVLTVGVFNVFGTAGKLVTISSVTGGSPAYISRPYGGILSTGSNDYLSIQDIRVVQPLSFWAGANSTSVSGNTNIYFTALSGTYRHCQSTALSIAASSVTATFPASTTAGNLLVAYVMSSGTTGGGVVAPTGFTQAVTSSQSSTGYIYYKVANGTETSVTYSQTTSRTLTMQLVEYSGFTGVPTLDGTDSNNSGIAVTSLSTTASTGPTNSSQPSLALAWVGAASSLAATVSITNGFSEDYTQGLLSGSITRAAVKELSTLAAVDTTFTWTTPRASMHSGLAMFKNVVTNSGNFFQFF